LAVRCRRSPVCHRQAMRTVTRGRPNLVVRHTDGPVSLSHSPPRNRGHAYLGFLRPPGRNRGSSTYANNRYAHREPMKRHAESSPLSDGNSLPFADPLPERQEPILKRQIQPTARWPPGKRHCTLQRRSSCSVARNSAPDLEPVRRRPCGQRPTRMRVRHLRRSRLRYFAAVLSDSLFELSL
jgi:hypothetical protein